jgi:GNAT superfamily N-acetyltransferase
MMSSMTMRNARPGDAAAIRALVRAAYAKWVPVVGREPRPMQADYEQNVLVHRFDLIEESGRLVALIETEPHDGHLWVENIAVAPEAQGRGLGRRLLAHADHLARAGGFGEIRLLTHGLMASNRALYRSVGYVETLEEAFMENTVVYFTKLLA